MINIEWSTASLQDSFSDVSLRKAEAAFFDESSYLLHDDVTVNNLFCGIGAGDWK